MRQQGSLVCVCVDAADLKTSGQRDGVPPILVNETFLIIGINLEALRHPLSTDKERYACAGGRDPRGIGSCIRAQCLRAGAAGQGIAADAAQAQAAKAAEVVLEEAPAPAAEAKPRAETPTKAKAETAAPTPVPVSPVKPDDVPIEKAPKSRECCVVM